MQLSELAKLLEAPLEGEDLTIPSISINTRELTPGQLFIALKGEQFDGHDFLQEACNKKAAAAIVSKDVQLPIPVIRVKDTRIALGKIAAFHRNKFKVPVVALTGSCGKTTTKTMLASILSEMGSTLSPEKSFNNDVGVPLTLLQLNSEHQYVVLEMGANHPHEIAYLSGIAKQDVSLITNVAPAHLEGFGTVEGVAKAKGEIYQGLSDQGIAIINVDDQFAPFWQKSLGSRSTLSFGIVNHADVKAMNISLDDEARAQFDVEYPDGKLHIQLPLPGNHNVMNALAAIAAAHVLGANKDAIVQGLQKVTPVSKRLIRYRGRAGSFVIDDTYNANPLSVSAALATLTHGVGEKIFVFGGMAELGKDEEKFHTEVGQKARNLGINKLYACGKLSQFSVDAFGENGFHFQDQQSLIEALKKILHPNAVVLIKGSRSAKMENVVQALIQEN